ncbi:hypothetical protein E2C01_007826 [Portunus trituberculatus]|uniref:Uncharacterized protein n=1 Tax=Portunus trituberculatus TaxID=210409 RepID=A0A5B7D281_PORTR|nr:hypothetical protein [Portunus trituberculatus]
MMLIHHNNAVCVTTLALPQLTTHARLFWHCDPQLGPSPRLLRQVSTTTKTDQAAAASGLCR